jgi:hypothetical protein
MQKIMLIVLAALVIIVLLAAWKVIGGRKGGAYYLRPALFTAAERSFLGVLEQVLPPGVRVFGKVRLADVFGVKRGLNPSDRQGARNRIDRKHVDFLLVRRDGLAPLAGIELDDKSHEAEERQHRDAFVDGVFAGAGLPLLHVAAQKTYNLEELRAKIGAILSGERTIPPKIGWGA